MPCQVSSACDGSPPVHAAVASCWLGDGQERFRLGVHGQLVHGQVVDGPRCCTTFGTLLQGHPKHGLLSCGTSDKWRMLCWRYNYFLRTFLLPSPTSWD